MEEENISLKKKVGRLQSLLTRKEVEVTTAKKKKAVRKFK